MFSFFVFFCFFPSFLSCKSEFFSQNSKNKNSGKRSDLHRKKDEKKQQNTKNAKKVAIAYRNIFKLEIQFFTFVDDPVLRVCSEKKMGFDIFFLFSLFCVDCLYKEIQKFVCRLAYKRFFTTDLSLLIHIWVKCTTK